MASPSGLYQQDVEECLIRSDPSQKAAMGWLDTLQQEIIGMLATPWYRRWQHRGIPKGLYLWGGVGTGKTLVMDFFYRSLPDGVAWRVHFHHFLQWVHERRQSHGDRREPLHLVGTELAKKYQVLCLDEFSVTDITDAMILYGLLRALFRQRVILVTTSNIPMQDLYRDGLQRDRFLPAVRLLEQHSLPIHVDSGHDYRMAYLQESAIYYTPLGKDADAMIEDTFRNLVGMHEPNDHQIVVGGRKVPVVATGSGVVWFEFAVLCRGHRSRSDYVQIARRFHTVLLANVPILDNDQNDPARRLMELIDVLYDRGVNLILSAAVLPDALYTGKRLTEPFRRAVSRLHEMSSREYLAKPHLP